MKRHLLIFLTCILVLAPTVSAQTPSSSVIVGYEGVTQYESIPYTYIQAAMNEKTMIRHASVGGNVRDGLVDLESHPFPYWDFQYEGNPGWEKKLTDFQTEVSDQLTSFDVVTMKYCYIDDSALVQTYIDKLEDTQKYVGDAGKKMIWWTMPIKTAADTDTAARARRNAFNSALRSYASANSIYLFDVAAIESQGDLSSTATMASAYSDDSGHLNSVGAEAVAKAWWVMMARVAGWTPDGSAPVLPPVEIPTITHTPTPTPSRTPTPSPTPTRPAWQPIDTSLIPRLSGSPLEPVILPPIEIPPEVTLPVQSLPTKAKKLYLCKGGTMQTISSTNRRIMKIICGDKDTKVASSSASSASMQPGEVQQVECPTGRLVRVRNRSKTMTLFVCR